MKKTRLFLIDIDLSYLEYTAHYLSSTRDIEVVGYITDASQAVTQIARAQPDCVVLGLAQRSCYGLDLLRKLRAISPRTAFILWTAFSSNTVLQLSLETGADMFLCKPVPMEQLHKCILETTISKRKLIRERLAADEGATSPSPTSRIHYGLIDAGILPRMFGFSCLSESLYLLLKDGRLLCNLRRNLYPQVAQALRTTPENVERNMRTAIRHARGDDALSSMTNRQFLSFMLQKLTVNPDEAPLSA